MEVAVYRGVPPSWVGDGAEVVMPGIPPSGTGDGLEVSVGRGIPPSEAGDGGEVMVVCGIPPSSGDCRGKRRLRHLGPPQAENLQALTCEHS